jgi:hypothetical protein
VTGTRLLDPPASSPYVVNPAKLPSGGHVPTSTGAPGSTERMTRKLQRILGFERVTGLLLIVTRTAFAVALCRQGRQPPRVDQHHVVVETNTHEV